MKSIAAILDDVSKALHELPTRVAREAVNFSKERFVKQNWLDTGEDPWPKRSRARRGGKLRQRGAVLVDSGRLKRSIRATSVSSDTIVIGTDVPYAELHNEGLKSLLRVKKHNRRSRSTGKVYEVKAHSRQVNMPQRRFIGESQELVNRIENLMQQEIEHAINH
jgi:phage gpG-like protein